MLVFMNAAFAVLEYPWEILAVLGQGYQSLQLNPPRAVPYEELGEILVGPSNGRTHNDKTQPGASGLPD